MGNLVLSRRLDEVIAVGPDIRITVVAIRGDAVRIGIDAPRDIYVHRLEVLEAIQRTGGDPMEKRKAGDIPSVRFDPATGEYGPGPETTREQRNAEKQRERDLRGGAGK